MVRLGQRFPDFELPILRGTDINSVVKLSDYTGKWLCLYFYPVDFSLLCPTEIQAFSEAVPEFRDRDCEVLGGSCDSVYSHLGWVTHREEMKGLQHPLFSDYKKTLASALGIIEAEKGMPQRATFLIDPNGIIRFIYVTDLNIGRSPDEVLRVLDALRTDELCPCNWKKGDPTLSI